MKKIDSLTGIRFLLMIFIVNGHFVQVSNISEFWLRFWKQHNMIVGCFFVLSGYIISLTSEKKRPTQDSLNSINATSKFFLKRLARVYPVYLFVLLIFTPMFVYIEIYYQNTIGDILIHIILLLTMTQAWIPNYGTLWNGPTWFLSSIALSWVLFPYINNKFRKLSSGKILCCLILCYFTLLGIRVFYSYLSNWNYAEGMLNEERIPWFNFFRFFPPFNFLEVLFGMLAARFFILFRDRFSNLFLSLGSISSIGLLAVLFARVYFPINDLFVRSLIILPIFTLILFGLSTGRGWLNYLLSRRWIVFLGKMSFSIFVLHGALGQLFYKRVVKEYTGLPEISYLYYLIVLFIFSYILYKLIEVPFGTQLVKRMTSRR